MQAKPTNAYHPDHQTLKQCISYLKDTLKIKRPVYAGVGIKNSEDVAMAKAAGADGVFVGSTVLKLHNDIPKLRKTINALKQST